MRALLRSWRAASAAALVVVLAVVNACSSGTISGGGDDPVAGLRFTLQPVASSGAGTTFSVSVELLNSSGQKIGSADDVVTLTVTGGATLSGNTSQAAVNGVATFSGLSITKSGTGYTITASANGVNASSSSFTITPGAASATQSSVTLNPTNVTVGATIQATFTFKDQYGNPIANKAVSLTSTLAGLTFNPASGTTNASGVFTTNFIATGAGTATLNATVDGLELSLPGAVGVAAPVQYTIATSSSPANGGATTGGGTFNSGASVTVTATANTNFAFTNWTEGANVVSTNASFQFTATANRTLVANFTSTNNCTVGALTIPGNVNGTLAASCMAGTQQSATFRFTATGTGAIGLTATSAAFTPLLDVITDPGLVAGVAFSSSPVSIEWLLPAGTYQARVRGSASGAFTLAATNPAGNTNNGSFCQTAPARRAFLVGGTFAGQSLGTGDCTFQDGSFVDFYFIGTAGQCTIKMTPSAGINAFVAIFDAVTGEFLDAIDDNPALGGVEQRTYNACRNGNSPIIIGMNAFAAGQSGSYTMEITIPNGQPAELRAPVAETPVLPTTDFATLLRQFRKR